MFHNKEAILHAGDVFTSPVLLLYNVCYTLSAGMLCFSAYFSLKFRKSAVIKVIQEEGELEWQKEWNASTKGEITKSFFPVIRDRKSKRLQMCIKLSTLVTGHGTLRSYYHRFKIIDEPEYVCKMGPQTTDHLIWECVQLRKQR